MKGDKERKTSFKREERQNINKQAKKHNDR